MIVWKGKQLTSIHYDRKTMTLGYVVALLVWEILQFRSCFGSGYWIDDLPWEDDDPWNDGV